MARSFVRTGVQPPAKSLTKDELLVFDTIEPGVGEDELAVLTNLSLGETNYILARLEQLGLVAAEAGSVDDDGAVPWLGDELPLATVEGIGGAGRLAAKAAPPPPRNRPADRPTLANLDLAKELAKMSGGLGEGAEEMELPLVDQRKTSVPPPIVLDDEVIIVEEADRPTLPPPTHLDGDDLPPDTLAALSSVQLRTAHALFVTEYAQLPLLERLRYAQEGASDTLLALCFDANPHVLRSLLAHPFFGVEHARVAAKSHGSKEGLEAIAAVPLFADDTEVRDAIFGNPASSEAAVDALVARMTVAMLYAWTMDGRAPERTKALLRRRFQELYRVRSAEERLEVLLSSEGACLTLLGGVALDARTSQLLTMQPTLSPTLLANLARFPGAPPSLMTHLAGMPTARSSSSIRALLLAHPNLSEARKRTL